MIKQQEARREKKPFSCKLFFGKLVLQLKCLRAIRNNKHKQRHRLITSRALFVFVVQAASCKLRRYAKATPQEGSTYYEAAAISPA
jgi:hypothetical protein